MSETLWTAIRRAYGLANAALWALVTALAISLVAHVPQLMEAQAAAERQLILEMAQENREFCEKWGLGFGSHRHTLCTLDVQEIRKRHEQRLLADFDAL